MLSMAALVAGCASSGASPNGTPDAEIDPGLNGPARVPPSLAHLVLDHGTELELTDAQRGTIERIRVTQDSINRPFLARLDSLRPTRRPAGGPGDLSVEQRADIIARRKSVSEVMTNMRAANATSHAQVMAALTEVQRTRATQLEDDARKASENEQRRRGRQNMNGGRGAAGGRRPPGA